MNQQKLSKLINYVKYDETKCNAKICLDPRLAPAQYKQSNDEKHVAELYLQGEEKTNGSLREVTGCLAHSGSLEMERVTFCLNYWPANNITASTTQMASKSKEQQSPVKRRFTSPLGNQKYVTKGISPRFKTNLKDFRSFGPAKQSKQRGDLGPNGKPWRKPQRGKAVQFHCGGNSADPLNLDSLIDRDPAAVTPQASPLSVHSESPVEVLEPRDKTDPLNLKGFLPGPENNASHVTPKKRKKRSDHKTVIMTPKMKLGQKSKQVHCVGRCWRVKGRGKRILQAQSRRCPMNSEKHKEIGKCHRSNKGKEPKRDKHPGKHDRKEKLFIYGNYNRYYGYRNPQCSQDLRLKCFKKEWFSGKDVLDLGCNVGHVSLTIARDFNPHVITGIDIDTSLIKAAKNNLRFYMQNQLSVPGTSRKGMDFPVSFSVTSGPLAAPVVLGNEEKLAFPHNVVFQQSHKVDPSKLGDEGLKLMFKRIFMNLRPGGRLILEPQPFSTYKKKKNLTEKIRSNYDTIRFRPEHFVDYLLSDMVGFASFEVLEIPQHKATGFQRPMYLLTKASNGQN
ncbi:hypothetical protein OS493_013974 [Desmophyllum pertusum]|uniref:RNA methyltransferase n=1 Tax=Desmophyllum pertusum TaxID=174260 RepID=A0A9W9ZEL4_9CNID|nr:hypothetical protein OS493_013974 [Desmophyllum pertusum]